MNVMVAIPYKAKMPHRLMMRMFELAGCLPAANHAFRVHLSTFSGMVSYEAGVYAAAQAAARNALLDLYWTPALDYVMWIDSDLVDYPADIITRLFFENPQGITAPSVLIENTDTFYDTYGYVEAGNKVKPRPPYFSSPERVVTMEAVGCAYLIPAWIYATCRYKPTPGHTEHYSVMESARTAGCGPIVCVTDVTVYHANLPAYGLEWHGH